MKYLGSSGGTRRRWNDRCLNCKEPGRCLCVACIRAMVVPVLVVELVRVAVRLVLG